MATASNSHRDIISYYDTCEWDYRIIWHTHRTLALHYGFWTPGVRSLAQAQINQNEWMAELAGIGSSDKVLDAGCGIGGSSMYLAGHRGSQCTGISLSRRQVEQARALAAAQNLNLLDFQVRDFSDTGFASGSFSVVWGIESVCHAADKVAFLREAYRLLEDGGRLIIADGFSQQPVHDMNHEQERLMRGWLEPWAVESLSTTEEFCHAMQGIGFKDIHSREVTDLVLPSARILHNRAWMATVPAHLMYWLGLRNKIQHANFKAGKFQWRSLEQNLWHYSVVTARK